MAMYFYKNNVHSFSMMVRANLFFFQGNRDESYEVDEELAEQDATSLYEVPTFSHTANVMLS